MRIKKDVLTQKLVFVGIDSSDHITRKTGLSSFTVYYSLNGGTATVMTTPTVAELDATNMKGDYTLLIDEAGMVSTAGELTLSITVTGMDPVTRIVEITTNLESDLSTDIADVPTVAEFEARSILAADYVVTSDTIAGVITCTTNTDLVTAANVVDEFETQSQLDPTGFHVNVKEVNDKVQTANDNGADINAILSDTGELQTDWVNGGRLDLLLDACAIETTVAALNNISVADIIAGIADGSYDLQEMMRIMFAALSGKSSGGGTVTLKFRDSGDGKDRISATVDATGNRTAITLDGS